MAKAAQIAGGVALLLGAGGIAFATRAYARGSRGTRTHGEITPPLPPPVYPAYPSGAPVPSSAYTMPVWIPVISSIIATSYPRIVMPFAIAWGELESGGNPGAVGDPGQLGPDQEPAEIGLGQLYNPDDFRAFGQSPAAFRAYLPAAAPLASAYRAAKIDWQAAQGRHDDAAAADAKARMSAAARTMQTVTRPLTSAEMDQQARWTLLAKIDQCMHTADQTVAKFSLAHWSVPDYWKLVKAPHALPVILSSGMPAVVKKLGRAPSSWAEFRAVLGMEGNPQWVRALNACEACGNAVAPAVA